MFKRIILTLAVVLFASAATSTVAQALFRQDTFTRALVFQQDTFTPSDCFVRFEGDLASSFCANGPGKQRVEVNCTGGGKVEGPWVAVNTNSFVACVTNVASARTGKVSPYVP